MNRALVLVYGSVCYVLFLGTLLYSIGFVGNLGVPKTVDSGPAGPIGAALMWNLGLLSLFALQHSGMARPAFKRWWTRLIPESVERSTYVLLTSALMLLLYWQWRPIEATVWEFSGLVGGFLQVLYFAGWGLVFYSTILIDHFDLFGMRQVVLHFRGRAYEPLPFDTPSLYKWVRHPLYVGWFTVFWVTPQMSAGHLLLALVTTVYILVAVRIEENDLLTYFGDTYARYVERVPRFLPLPRRNHGSRSTESVR
jgi:protein-S-isoprenylcysteine O-methyltransferase Ste14